MMEEKKLSAPVRVIRTVYNIISTVLIVLGAAVALLWIAGIRPYAVVSGSMEPGIKVGSVCVVNLNASYSKVKKGDIIAFKVGDGVLVTHRAVSITEDGIITKGDANNADDAAPVGKKDFVGKTLFSIPLVGYIITFIHTRHGLIASAAILAAFILIGVAIPDKKREKKK